MVQQRDTSGCITTPAAMLDAALIEAAPLIEKQRPPFQGTSRLAMRRNGTARFRKLTVLPMRILQLRRTAHLHLTLHAAASREVRLAAAFEVCC